MAVHFIWNDQDCFNIHHIDNGAGAEWSPVDLAALGNAYAAWWADQLAPLQSISVTLATVKVRDLSTDTGNVVEGAYGGQGEIVEDSLPNNVTIAVKWVTGLAGRSARGRTYFIGMCDSQRSQNVIDDAFATALEAAYNGLLAAITATGFGNLCVLSRQTGGNPRAEGVGLQIHNASFADLSLDSQRRRLPGK